LDKSFFVVQGTDKRNNSVLYPIFQDSQSSRSYQQAADSLQPFGRLRASKQLDPQPSTLYSLTSTSYNK